MTSFWGWSKAEVMVQLMLLGIFEQAVLPNLKSTQCIKIKKYINKSCENWKKEANSDVNMALYKYSVRVNFMCQLDWSKGCLDSW